MWVWECWRVWPKGYNSKKIWRPCGAKHSHTDWLPPASQHNLLTQTETKQSQRMLALLFKLPQDDEFFHYLKLDPEPWVHGGSRIPVVDRWRALTRCCVDAVILSAPISTAAYRSLLIHNPPLRLMLPHGLGDGRKDFQSPNTEINTFHCLYVRMWETFVRLCKICK